MLCSVYFNVVPPTRVNVLPHLYTAVLDKTFFSKFIIGYQVGGISNAMRNNGASNLCRCHTTFTKDFNY